MSPELRAFTALCGGVDSRDGPAAAAATAGDDEGQDVGEEGRHVRFGCNWGLDRGRVPPH